MNFLMTSIFKPITLSLLTVFVASLGSFGADEACAQEQCVTYKTYLHTFYRDEPVIESKMVNETAFETKTITKQRPVYTTETRTRKTFVMKPVQTTGERIETETLSRKVEETKYRDVQVEEEAFEDVTEMRDEQYTVQKSVKETLFREQQETVRVPVTETRMESENVTAYRPVEVSQQSYQAAQLVIPGAASQASPRRSVDWLRPGYYTDPVTGKSVYRRGGLHWVMEPQNRSAVVPVIIPQETKSVALVPETFKREKPVQVTRYVDKVETRKVPVEVDRVIDEIRTRKVPVTVRKPVKKLVTKRVPYTSTTYEPVEVTRRVPTMETVQKRVEVEEPYEVTVCKWVPFTETIRVPKTVAKKVDYKTTRKVPYTVTMRVACDQFGNRIGQPEPIPGTERIDSNWAKTRPLVQANQSESTTRTPISSATRETAATGSQSGLSSVLDSDPARFDISDSSEPQPKAASTVPSIRSEEISPPALAPESIEFPATTKFEGIAKTELATIERDKSTRETSVRTPKKSDLDIYLEERSRRNLSNAGLSPVIQSKRPASDESLSTSMSSGTDAKTLEETSTSESQLDAQTNAAVEENLSQEESTPIQVDAADFLDAVPPSDIDGETGDGMDAIERDVEVERDN